MAKAATAKKTKWAGTGGERDAQIALKREAVFNTAARLFNERGYHATTLDEVAAELRVTKAALYYYIHDKDEILFECQRQAFASFAPALERIADRSVAVVDRLKFFLHVSAHVMASDYGKCLIRTGIRQLKPASRNKIMVLVRSLDDELLRLIEEGVAAGVFREGSSLLIRNFIFGAFQGISLWYNASGTCSVSEIVDAYSTLLLDGLMSPKKRKVA